MNRKPIVLLTGAKGRLAPSVISRLSGDYDLRLTDKATNEAGQENYISADLLDFAQVLELMKGVDAVVHLAVASDREFEGRMAEDKIDPLHEAMLQVNVQGTYHVFEAARRHGVSQMVFASSLTVYFGDKHRPNYREDMVNRPQNVYACTKIFGEELGKVFSQSAGISVACLRIGQPYPLGIDLDDFWRENRRARSSYVSVEDVALAVWCALDARVPFGIYNIVSASDNQRFSLSAALEIGYRPRGYFSDAGFAFCEPDCIPVSELPVVTHDEGQ